MALQTSILQNICSYFFFSFNRIHVYDTNMCTLYNTYIINTDLTTRSETYNIPFKLIVITVKTLSMFHQKDEIKRNINTE